MPKRTVVRNVGLFRPKCPECGQKMSKKYHTKGRRREFVCVGKCKGQVVVVDAKTVYLKTT